MKNTIKIPKEIFEQVFFKDGGTKTDEFARAITGQFQKGLPEDSPVMANAEVEKNEFIKDSNGVRKIEGKTHEAGGVDVNLEDGAQVLSDHLKIGGDLARYIKKTYELKVKASDTYAKVLDKHLRKIGLFKKTEDFEATVKKLEKQKQEVEDETTLALNQEVLMQMIHDLGQEIKPLETEKEKMFDVLFNAQEASKKEEGDTSFMQEGGVFSLANKYGISEERLKELIPQYQKGGEAPKLSQNTLDAITVGKMVGQAPKYTPEQKQAIKKYYETVVLDKNSLKALNERLDNDTLVFNQNLLQEIQQNKNIPLQYQSETEKNLYGVQTDSRLKEYLYQSDFQNKFGRPFGSKPNDEALIYDEIIKGLEDEGIKYHGSPTTNKGTKLFGDVNAGKPKFIKQMSANKEYTLDVSKYKSSSPQEQESLARALGLDKTELDKEAGKITTGYINFAPTTQSAPSITAPTEAPTGSPLNLPTGEVEGRKRPMGLLLLPDQSPLRPPSMLAPSVEAPRVYSHEYMHISPNQQLNEFARTQQGVQKQIDQLPDAQRAATLASLDANNASNLSRVIAETTRYNSQADTQTAAAQAQAMTQQSALDVAANLQNQQLMGRELEGYEADLQNYYNRLNENNINNWKHINMINRGNALNPDVQFTDNGYEVINFPEDRFRQDVLPTSKKGGTFKKKKKKRF